MIINSERFVDNYQIKNRPIARKTASGRISEFSNSIKGRRNSTKDRLL